MQVQKGERDREIREGNQHHHHQRVQGPLSVRRSPKSVFSFYHLAPHSVHRVLFLIPSVFPSSPPLACPLCSPPPPSLFPIQISAARAAVVAVTQAAFSEPNCMTWGSRDCAADCGLRPATLSSAGRGGWSMVTFMQLRWQTDILSLSQEGAMVMMDVYLMGPFISLLINSIRRRHCWRY